MTTQGIEYDMVPYIVERFGDAYQAQTHDFVERVLDDRGPAVDAHDARAALLIGLAARRSYDKGRVVTLAEYCVKR